MLQTLGGKQKLCWKYRIFVDNMKFRGVFFGSYQQMLLTHVIYSVVNATFGLKFKLFVYKIISNSYK